MSKPRVDPTFGISSVDVLIPTERHPACRRRESRPGSGTERENLAGDGKGKGASGSNREAESTDAPERGGLPRSSCVKKTRKRHAVGEMKDGPSESPCRRRLQTAMSCSGTMAGVVNVMVKRRGYDCVMYG
jgi:hypothetical protein